ncbi:MAG: phosphopyruvate hydratase [Candidatus Kerfeldbacteria bacterium CG15_BIG_FIL_POST_REV_8_21_14_020_45_12]|uniref:Enolase n=2 Tax=Parcubacteria group TaxID=1794811 RepID=A0A2M8ENK6_9BACT|nr:MAG: phosphopyruvate hydratase [Candidatus Kerfeldbacteria bacterium CG15_BIG_FIL_POST_REV_8_21_14_020_45_12]PIX61807.1 MAG: phosphopyruvate hydratase [Candidatus Uhrbacteria bacterium CG_4_10_14_3_um_filter_41_21]PIZ54900.1 MAG: phosphopyruvate hydratase [Candidatus Uhrbacteria bacterium CG_4_10_14_0_2_um_filter_41_21]PJB84517.1 MAG: phosphopyruvate hydratase [Candidatus Uhrbacteria bacterium CG_4_9_14_0_8_um_filter_41_16]PJC24271.1 MAG: phosphopyruvate hydratase [Candidatus Uhrbacteria bac
MKEKIDLVHAHEILDSRGNPTLNVTVVLKDGTRGSASVPSGASTGIHEVLELRDNDPRRYGGKGVLKAVNNVNVRIQKLVKGMDVFHLQKIDDDMRISDGTVNKHKLGANAILGVSMACAHAGAKRRGIPLYKHLREIYNFDFKTYKLPTPLMNVFNGGRHASTNLDMQEFIVIPHGFKTVRRKIQAGAEIFHALGEVLYKDGHDLDVGNEGGYAPNVGKTEDALEYLTKAVRRAKYKLGKEIGFGIDIAASEFYDQKKDLYILKTDRRKMTAGEMTGLLGGWMKKYPLMSIEDPLDQDAWQDWRELTAELGKKSLVIGDDLFVTNTERLKKGIDMKVANAILIKMNQIGTMTETMEAIALAQKYKYKVVISHRSGETADSTIADLAVAVNAEYIKTGAPSRSERLVKYNRLMEIEESL